MSSISCLPYKFATTLKLFFFFLYVVKVKMQLTDWQKKIQRNYCGLECYLVCMLYKRASPLSKFNLIDQFSRSNLLNICEIFSETNFWRCPKLDTHQHLLNETSIVQHYSHLSRKYKQSWKPDRPDSSVQWAIFKSMLNLYFWNSEQSSPVYIAGILSSIPEHWQDSSS